MLEVIGNGCESDLVEVYELVVLIIRFTALDVISI
jgi:hypothetical protein